MRPRARFVVAGLLATAAGLAVGELMAAATRPAAGPVVAVGAAVIDATPTPVKEYAVRTFGTWDKPLLLAGIALALAALAAGVGVAAGRRRRLGAAGALLFGMVGAAAALSHPTAGPVDALPSLCAALVTAGALSLLIDRAAGAPAAGDTPMEPAHAADAVAVDAGVGRPARLFDRRAFLGTAALVAGGTAVVGTGAAAVRRAAGGAAGRSRRAVRLPPPGDPAPPLPAGLPPGFVTPNADFYRVDTALTVPQVDLDRWRLRIGGMVDRPLTLSFADLLARPLMERHITLNCVSNEVGGPYVGTARWLGVPLAPLLREAGIRAGADQLVARSVEGMTIGTPVATLLDGRDAMLCVGMNDEPLPLDHGFPVRMLTPGLYGYAGACKWVAELELTTFEAFDAYWVRRDWAPRAPVKTASRIDRPAPLTTLPAGPATVAGVAWAQGRGIRAVEIQVDDGPWAAATLAPVPSTDTWVQWRYAWAATPGLHRLQVRATDGTGEVQTAARVTPFPAGATGWHGITVTVA